jgi:hypothetical protein
MTCHQAAGQSHNINVTYKYFDNVAKLNFFGKNSNK